jgi:hypothetical protein
VNEKGAFAHTLTTLGEAFGTPSSRILSRVIATCTAFHEAECCPRCFRARPFTSRTDYTSRPRYGHAPAVHCQACRNAEVTQKREVAEREKALLQERVDAVLRSKRAHGLRLEQMSLTDALHLLSVVRAGGAEDLTYIYPRSVYKTQLSPTEEIDFVILRHLYARGVLCAHPGSQPGTILPKDAGYEFYLDKIRWLLPLAIGELSPAQFAENVDQLGKSDAWPLE